MSDPSIVADTSTITRLTELAAQYGVTFFAVLFVVFVTYWANRQYKDAMAREPVDEAEVKTKRRVFVASFVSGLVLVCISIVFAFFGIGTGQIYIARGVIKFVEPTDRILPDDDIYFREVPRYVAHTEEDSLQVADQHFMVVKASPFVEGELFHVDLAKPSRRPSRLAIEYHKQPAVPAFEIRFNAEANAYALVPLDSQPAKKGVKHASLNWLPSLVRAAYAQDPAKAPPPPKPTEASTRALNRLVDSLQAPRSSVAAKLDALDAAATIGPDKLNDVLFWKGSTSEPVLTTLLDLSRHSDPEIAAKARYVLKRGDYEQLIANGVSSPDQNKRKTAEDALFRMDKTQGAKIVSAAKLNPSLAARVAADTSWTALRPTASPQGDRYYVRARWDSTNVKTRDCLTVLFNKELISERTLDQERRLMAGKSERLVYWYDKSWTEEMSRKIVACGAKAAFVTPYGSAR